MRARVMLAAVLATLAWVPQSVQNVSAIYCYPGDPPAVYQACVAYNQGIGQQVNNQNQLNSIQSQISNTIAQINAIDALISSLQRQIDAQKALIAQTQAAIDDLSRKIRFGEATLIQLKAHVSVRKQLADQLKAQYDAVQAERAAIDAEVAKLALAYDAAAVKAGGGNGVFEWPVPACGPSCMSQRFGCSSFYLEVYDPNCPYPHKIHTGIDIAAPYGSDIVAADTGVAYLYPGSVGYGNLLVVIHGHGYSTYYGHLSGYAPGLSSGEGVPGGTTV